MRTIKIVRFYEVSNPIFLTTHRWLLGYVITLSLARMQVFQAKTQEDKVVKFLFENIHHWFPQKQQKFEGLLLKG